MADFGSPQIGPFILQLRKQQSLTLDMLARASGVSRSMLSQIERGQTNPTVATVWALAEALNVDVSELIGSKRSEKRVRIEVASASFTPEIKTDDSLCVLRILSPAHRRDDLEWYELIVAPGGALISAPHSRGTREHLTVIEGTLTIVAGAERGEAGAGETARYPADIDHEVRNCGSKQARAFLVVATH